ncbi:hypothetical protein HK407_09g15160 [Ordospora pajunii]|jgi:hypothetical protein|uniref:uncharacterized protein n=1 Tax=Ordospora pajunii TaxID=3039483 RepID=UPI0029527552|nr:uncharacterized protein HK407_09g15160 [Ordospora pajunii]KAH9410921.1 hypothetical protein HK407_09g15160 [Ordospora pajunii]
MNVCVLENDGGQWNEMCVGMALRIHKGSIFVEDINSSEGMWVDLCGKAYTKFEENVVHVFNEDAEHALCFETEKIRNEFYEFLSGMDVSAEDEQSGRSGSKENIDCKNAQSENWFAKLKKASMYMENDIFEQAIRSKQGIAQLVECRSLYLFRMLVEHGNTVFEVLGVPLCDSMSPYLFYKIVIAGNFCVELARVYESFVRILDRKEMASRNPKVAELPLSDVVELLKMCCSRRCKFGSLEAYLSRMYIEKEDTSEMFYYICYLFRNQAAEKIDFVYVFQRIDMLVALNPHGDQLLYLFEGLYIMLELCSAERLDMFFIESSVMFKNTDLVCNEEIQKFMLYLFSRYGFRARELFISTGILKKAFSFNFLDIQNRIFISKMLNQVASSNKTIHTYFIKNDLLRNASLATTNIPTDAACSIFRNTLSKASGELKKYIDAFIMHKTSHKI